MDILLPYLAPLYGAGVIIFYAFGRFNEASYDTKIEFRRLNTLLSVGRMRTASVVRLSFLYYTIGLLVIYLLVSAYMILFAESRPEPDPSVVGGIAPGPVIKGMGSSGMVFLGVALAVVGLGPNIPFVRNVEAWLRRSAHGLAGIPTRVLAHTRELREKDFVLTEDQLSQLLLPEDRRVVKKVDSTNMELLRDIALIAAIGSWVLNTRSVVGDSRLNEAFRKLEDELRRRKNDLFQRIQEGKVDQYDIIVISEADELADDVCVLLALYQEHRLLEKPPETTETQRSSVNQTRRMLVSRFVGPSESRSDEQLAEWAMLAISWAFGVILVLALVWSAWPGVLEHQIRYPDNAELASRGWGRRLLERATDGLFALFLPVAIGVGIWQGAKASGSWGRGLCANWTQALPRALLIFACSWAVGTFFLCGLSLWSAAFAKDWSALAGEWVKSLANIFAYHAPGVLSGALLAVLVVGCLDRWQESTPGYWTSWSHAVLAALFVGLTGGVTRLHGILSLKVPEAVWPSEYKAGSVVYAALYSGLIALFLIYGLSSTLRDRKPPDREEDDKEPENAPNPAVMLLVLLLCVPPTDLAAQHITIGVREDARPYVWVEKDPETGRPLPKGYLWDVCALLTVNAGLTFTVASITADERSRFLEGERTDIDLLCDPTTVTLKRLTEFASLNLRFLPIFHLANSAFLERIPVEDKDEPTWWARCIARDEPEAEAAASQAGKSQDKDKPSCLRLSLQKERTDFGQDAKEVSTLHVAVEGTTSAHALRASPECSDNPGAGERCLFEKSHEDAAIRFCKSTTRIRYHGDVELILAAVRHWDETNPKRNSETPCVPERSLDPGGYEPYAFVISTKLTDLDRRLTLELYRMANEGRLGSILGSHFPCATISPDLESLFRILSVPAGIDPDNRDLLPDQQRAGASLPNSAAKRCKAVENISSQ